MVGSCAQENWDDCSVYCSKESPLHDKIMNPTINNESGVSSIFRYTVYHNDKADSLEQKIYDAVMACVYNFDMYAI